MNFDQAYSQIYKAHFGQLTAALLSIFSLKDIAVAEDIVQESFLSAYRHWQDKGIPDHPFAWLKKVCKNKAINYLRRHPKTIQPDFYLHTHDWIETKVDQIFLDTEIKDQQLRLLFSCCHPELGARSQLVFTLKTLGGLSNQEIGKALGSSKDTVGKLWRRTKKKIREENLPLTVPLALQSHKRLEMVHFILYLMFNEGYSASKGDFLIRKDLCIEALRLCKLIVEHEKIVQPDTYALMALMLFHTARFDSRLDEDGNILELARQDRLLWDASLIKLGLRYLKKARNSSDLSRWMIEATIASVHATAVDFKSTDWAAIQNLYRLLLSKNDNPFIRLNMAIATYYSEGPKSVLPILEKLKEKKALKDYHFLYATLGKVYKELGQNDEAIHAFHKASQLTRLEVENRFLNDQIQNIISHE